MPSTQLREIQKRRRLLVLKTIKKTMCCQTSAYIQEDDGNLSLDETSKKLAWKQHYDRC